MPSQKFFKAVLPHGELSDEVWRELIEWREFSLERLLDRYTPGTLGQAHLFPHDGAGRNLQAMAKGEGAIFRFAEGYSFDTQGVFRILKTPGTIRLGTWERLQLKFYLLGFVRGGKWIVAEAKLFEDRHGYGFQELEVRETGVDSVVQSFSIDRRTIWEFLGKSILDIYERKSAEFESLRAQAEEVRGENEFVSNLYGRTTYPF